MITTEIMTYVRRGTVNKPVIFSVGLSTDSKEELDPANGSLFREMDTGKIFIFDEDSSEWREQ